MTTILFFRWYGGRMNKAFLRRSIKVPFIWFAQFIASHTKCKQGIKWRDFVVVVHKNKCIYSANVNLSSFPNIIGATKEYCYGSLSQQ